MRWALTGDAQETPRRGCRGPGGRLDEIHSWGRTLRGRAVAQTRCEINQNKEGAREQEYINSINPNPPGEMAEDSD